MTRRERHKATMDAMLEGFGYQKPKPRPEPPIQSARREEFDGYDPPDLHAFLNLTNYKPGDPTLFDIYPGVLDELRHDDYTV